MSPIITFSKAEFVYKIVSLSVNSNLELCNVSDI